MTLTPGTAPSGIGLVRHMARQSALLLVTSPVSYAGGLALNLLLARALGTEGFGTWVVAQSVALSFARLSLMGADWIVIRYGSYYHGKGDEARFRHTVHLALLLGGSFLTVFALALLLFAPLVARELFHTPAITSLLRLAAVMAPVSGVGFIMLFGTKACKSLREEAIVSNLFRPAARLVMVGAAVLVRPSAVSAFIGLVIAEALIASASTYALNRRVRLSGPTAAIDRRGMIRFALPVWGSRIAENVRKLSFPLLLGSLASLAAAGVFMVAQRVALGLGAIIGAVEQIYSPMASSLYLEGRRSELQTLFQTMAKLSFTLAFPLFCLQVAFAADIMGIFGAAFRDEQWVLILMAVGMLFSFGTGPVTPTLLLAGRSRVTLVNYTFVVVAEIAVGVWLIPSHGVVGATVARMVGIAFLNGAQLALVWSQLGFLPYRRDFLKPVAAGIAGLAAARVVVDSFGVDSGLPTVLVASCVLAGAYLSILLVLGLSPEDRAIVQAVLRRRSAVTAQQEEGR